MNGFFAFLALLLGGQDPELARLIEKLNDHNVAFRDHAERDLIEKGAAALPALESALGRPHDSEFGFRAKRAILRIKANVELSSVLGLPTRILITRHSMTFKEAIREIDRQAVLEAKFVEEVENRKVTLELKGVSYFEALDRLCLAHGACRLTPLKKGGFEIRPGKPIVKPTLYSGPFRIRIEYIRIRRLVGGGTSPGTIIHFSTLWQPNVNPYRGAIDMLDHVIDASGVDLVSEDEREERRKYLWCKKIPARYRNVHPYTHLDTFPDADEGPLKSLSGSSHLRTN